MNDPAVDPDEEHRYQALQTLDLRATDATEVLIRALYDPGWRVRKVATERIGHAPDPASFLPRLLAVLEDRGETGARNAAAGALVQLGPASVPALLPRLEHHDPEQRKFASDILGLIGAAEAEVPLIRALDDADPNVRVAAAEALGRVGGDQAPRALERLLHGRDPLLRLSALESLMQLQAAPPLPVLVSLVEDPICRRAALRALGLVRQPAALQHIMAALGRDARGVREAALTAIGLQMDGAPAAWRSEVEAEIAATLRRLPGALERLEPHLAASDLHARRGVLFAIALIGDPAAVRAILQAAEEDALADDATRALLRLGPAAVRDAAGMLASLGRGARAVVAEALVQLADPGLVTLLTGLTASTDPDIQVLAVKALGRTRSPQAVAPLASLLSDGALGPPAARALEALSRSYPVEVRHALTAALSRNLTPWVLRAYAAVGGEDLEQALRRALRAPGAALRAVAAVTAGEWGGASAAEILRLALTDEALEVRAAAARGAGHLPLGSALPLLRLVLSDAEPAIVAAAIDAAAEAGAEALAPALAARISAPDGYLASRAVLALARLGKVDARVLEEAAHHPDPQVVREALLAGATLPEGVALARRLLSAARWDLRAAAARVLGAAAGGEVLGELDAALARESDPLVRDALMEARGRVLRR